MATLSYNEITLRRYIVLDSTPYEVVSSHIFRKQKRKPINQTKLKNLITGKVIEKSFHQSDNVEEADVGNKEIVYIFKKQIRNRDDFEFWFSEADNPKERFSLEDSIIGDAVNYIKENEKINALLFNDKIIGIKIPIKTKLLVSEAPPALRGNTAQGGTKLVTLETGIKVSTPLFINEGDYVVVNTDTGEYVERA